MCDEGVVKDEFHVILNCSKYSDLRQQVFNEIASFNGNINDMICLNRINLNVSYQMKIVFVSVLSSSVIF